MKWVDSKTALFAAFAFIATAVIFVHSSVFEYVGIDDPDYVLKNEHVIDGMSKENVLWAFTDRTYASNWHPLTWISLMADVEISRVIGLLKPERRGQYGDPVRIPMHVHNVVLHALNAALLFLLLWLLCEGRLNPIWVLLCTLAWSLHPLRTEAVCWISERKEVLSVFWLLLSFILYIRNRWFASFICAALAMMAKPVAVTLPAVLLAWDFIFCGRLRWLSLTPFALLSAFTCLMTMHAQTDAMELAFEMPLVSRLTAVFIGPLVYLRQTVMPIGLSLLYSNTIRLNLPLLIIGVGLVIGMLYVGIRWIKRRVTEGDVLEHRRDLLSITAFGIAWVYIGLLPMLGIVKVACQEHSDRYTYWIGCGASAFALLLLDWAKTRQGGIRRLVERRLGGGDWADIRKSTLIAFTGVVVVFAVMGYRRSLVWKDTITLYRDTMSKSWHTTILRSFSTVLESLGPEGKREAGEWVRGCVTHTPCTESYLQFARYTLSNAGWLSIGPFIESNELLSKIREDDPGHDEAVKLQLEIRKRLEKAGMR